MHAIIPLTPWEEAIRAHEYGDDDIPRVYAGRSLMTHALITRQPHRLRILASHPHHMLDANRGDDVDVDKSPLRMVVGREKTQYEYANARIGECNGVCVKGASRWDAR